MVGSYPTIHPSEVVTNMMNPSDDLLKQLRPNISLCYFLCVSKKTSSRDITSERLVRFLSGGSFFVLTYGDVERERRLQLFVGNFRKERIPSV